MAINLSSTTPAAPSGKQNVTWQLDGSNNISGYVSGSSPIQVVTSGSATTVTFSGIPGTFTNLRLVINARSNQASNTDALRMTFNSDTTGAHYGTAQYSIAFGSTVSAGTSTSSSPVGLFVANVSGTTATAGPPADYEIRINSYARTTFNKRFRSTGSCISASSTEQILDTTGSWLSTAAITSITFTLDSGNSFVNGSVFTLYLEP